MLSRPLRSSFQKLSSTRLAPAASTPAVATKSNSKFEVVKFVSEDLDSISKEVPNFSYYEMPEDRSSLSKYQALASPLSEKLMDVPDLPKRLSLSTKPELKFSQLENGLKICSIDKGGEATSLGLFVNAGSRFENPSNSGISHMLEMVAWRSTAHLSHLRTGKTLEQLGCVDYVNADANREYISYNATCLREYMPLVAPMMIGNVLYPRLLRWEVASAEKKIQDYQRQLLSNPDEIVSELLHEAGFHGNTLGRPLYATEASKSYMDEFTIRDYILNNFSPNNMSFVGVNVEHSELCKWLMRSFADYNAVPENNSGYREEGLKTPVYTGGYRYVDGGFDSATGTNGCHIGIGLEQKGGWNNSSDVFAVSVLRQLLGSTSINSVKSIGDGNSSTKLNKLSLASNLDNFQCHAFHRAYSDSGLFGIYAFLPDPSQTNQFLETVVAKALSPSTITADEVQKAKMALKRGVSLSNYSTGADEVADLGAQMIMSGIALSNEECCKKIDNVTENDVKGVLTKMMAGKVTVAAYGKIGWMPHYDVVGSMIKK